MNKRHFLSTLGKTIAGFSILPAATTYTRTWKRTADIWIPNPAWKDAEFEVAYFTVNPLDNVIVSFQKYTNLWHNTVRYELNDDKFQRVESHVLA